MSSAATSHWKDALAQVTNAMRAVYLRELAAYFLTPLAYVFIAIFLISLGAFTFEIGRFFETNQADLAPFFLFHPWLYLVFLPAIAMRLWADEARGGTLELLLSLPAPVWSLVRSSTRRSRWRTSTKPRSLSHRS